MIDDTAIHHCKSGATVLTGDAIGLFRAATLRSSIKLYAAIGMIPTRGLTIRRLLDMATPYTGKKYKNSKPEYARAIGDLDIWISVMKAAIPHTED